MTHVPLRMCVACREHKEPEKLLRITVSDGVPSLDIHCKNMGRGAYICRKSECIKKARKKHVIERHLKCSACDTLYDKAEELV